MMVSKQISSVIGILPKHFLQKFFMKFVLIFTNVWHKTSNLPPILLRSCVLERECPLTSLRLVVFSMHPALVGCFYVFETTLVVIVSDNTRLYDFSRLVGCLLLRCCFKCCLFCFVREDYLELLLAVHIILCDQKNINLPE